MITFKKIINFLTGKKLLVPSKELRQFLTDYYKSATELNGKGFSKRGGLCHNLLIWSRDRYKTDAERWNDNYIELSKELERLFEQEFNAVYTPFGYTNYQVRSQNYTQHLDPKRLAWIKSVLKRK